MIFLPGIKYSPPFKDASSLGYKEITVLLRETIMNRHLDQLKLKQVSKWSPNDVGQWISLLGFSQYKEAFVNNAIE
jgi:hypothetical protein